ncbi:MAG: hypothetical protein RIR79_476 [Pseudomonadota bacterium]
MSCGVCPKLPPMNELTITLFFLAFLCSSTALKLWLATRQIRHVAQHRSAVPAAFSSKIALPAHQKAADYTIAKARLGLIELIFGSILIVVWTLLGGLDTLNRALLEVFDAGLPQQVALMVCFTLIGSVLDLPFTLYQTFVLEERFGFNKTSVRLWLQDFAKSTAISLLIGLPLITLVLWLMSAAGAQWWLWVWGVLMGFNVLAMLIYPTWIAPLFNQFKPLDDTDYPGLQTRVTALMQRCGFNAKGLFVMDGSKRSAHANAYFTGFGASKRVVFYDTLLKQLTPDEVDAVLAHELGHFHHRHIVKRIVLMFAISLLGLFALGWVSQQLGFFRGLGVLPALDGTNQALSLLLFMMVLPLVSSFLSPIFAQLSRRDEFQADAFAASKTDSKALASALLKLMEDNASTLTPDPIYVKFYYSHPPAPERLAHLEHLARLERV